MYVATLNSVFSRLHHAYFTFLFVVELNVLLNIIYLFSFSWEDGISCHGGIGIQCKGGMYVCVLGLLVHLVRERERERLGLDFGEWFSRFSGDRFSLYVRRMNEIHRSSNYGGRANGSK